MIPLRLAAGFAVAVFCLPSAVHAQQTTPPAATVAPTPPAAFSFELGHAMGKGDGASATYTVLATQPLASKLVSQRIQLRIDGTRTGGTSTHTLLINTGKYKTVGAMSAYVAGIFQRFLAGPAAAGQEFGKIGDVRYGGEIRFVAASADQLDYKIVTPNTQDNLGHFDRADVQMFVNILVGTPHS